MKFYAGSLSSSNEVNTKVHSYYVSSSNCGLF